MTPRTYIEVRDGFSDQPRFEVERPFTRLPASLRKSEVFSSYLSFGGGALRMMPDSFRGSPPLAPGAAEGGVQVGDTSMKVCFGFGGWWSLRTRI